MKTLQIGSAYRGTHPELIGPIVRRTRSSLDSGGEASGTSHSLSPRCPGTKRRTSCLDHAKRNGRDSDNPSAPVWRFGPSVASNSDRDARRFFLSKFGDPIL